MTLRDAGITLMDCDHRTPPSVESGYAYVAIPQLEGGRINLADARRISAEHFAEWTRKTRPQPNDVVLSRRCNPGETASVYEGEEFALGQNLVLLRSNGIHVAPVFLRWLARGPLWMRQVDKFLNVGAVFDSLRCADVPKFELPIPPLEKQRAIAHILGTLDDKIELNRRASETLEAMARALFKSWFVDFDLVRAKSEGHQTQGALTALLPASFEDSEIGEVPGGWKVESLDAVADFLNGLALQKYPPDGDESLPVIKIAQLRAGNTIGADRASARIPAQYIIEDGEIVFSWSGSLECALWAGGRGALNQHLFKVTSTRYPKWLCYLAIQSHLDDFRRIAAGKATTMGHIQRHHLTDAKIATPPLQLLEAMNKVLAPIIDGVWRRAVESRTLAALRDTLLPKLISGELRVKDAERFVQDAV